MRGAAAVRDHEPSLAEALHDLRAIPLVGLRGAIASSARAMTEATAESVLVWRAGGASDFEQPRATSAARERERAHPPHTVFISVTSFDSDVFASPNNKLVLSL